MYGGYVEHIRWWFAHLYSNNTHLHDQVHERQWEARRGCNRLQRALNAQLCANQAQRRGWNFTCTRTHKTHHTAHDASHDTHDCGSVHSRR